MQAPNKAVGPRQDGPATVAKAFLQADHLLG